MPDEQTEAVAEAPRVEAARGAGVLSRSTLMVVRRVLNAFREGWLLEERLAAAARMTAEDARRLGLAAEHMLLSLKHEWSTLAEVRSLSVYDARELLDRLVSLSIRAYYEPLQARHRTDRPAGARAAGGPDGDRLVCSSASPPGRRSPRCAEEVLPAPPVAAWAALPSSSPSAGAMLSSAHTA